jgi:hypothetical protein
MTITEPATMLTDYLLTVAGAMFAIKIFRLRGSHRALALWILAFSFSAVAAFIGGTFHGFREHLSPSIEKGMWDATLIFIGATAAFVTAAIIVSSLRDRTKPHVPWLVRGLRISVAGLVFQKIGWAPHPSFTHNDVYHLIQVVGFWCLYQGARRLK